MQIIAYELMRQAPEKALQDVMRLFNAHSDSGLRRGNNTTWSMKAEKM